MKPWEIKLNREEIERFERILVNLKRYGTAGCPCPEGVTHAVMSKYCNKMCGGLFPSLIKRKSKYQLNVSCPCYGISTSHKIKVVRKLLKYNKKGGE